MQPILVINDSPEFLELMHDFLSGEGYAVETHVGGEAVLARVTLLRPRLIILDLVMGTIDGWVVLTQLRADDDAREIPVILCTAASDRARQHGEALASVGAVIMEKPFDLDNMQALIVELIGPAAETVVALDAADELAAPQPAGPA